MAETNLGSLRVSIGLDSAQFTQSMGDINRQMKIAQSEFEATSDGTKDYAKSLDGLRSKSQLLTRQTEIQRAKVEELRRRYEESQRTLGDNNRATQQALIAYNRARGGLNRFETQLRQVTDAIQDQTNVSKNGREALEKYAEKGKEIGTKLSTTLTPAIAGIGLAFVHAANDAEGSTQRIQAVLGITEEEAKKYGDTARDMWKKGFGENIEEVEKGLLSIKQNMKGLGEDDLQQATENALNLAGVFDSDVNEVARAGQNLMKGFGISSEKAFDLMAWGGQKGLNFSQEMFDNLSEYSPLYKKMGFSADEYFQLLQQGSESGVYNLDYINDAMKEFQIKTKDGSKSTSDAMGEMSKSTQKVWQDYLKGKSTIKEVHNAVINELSGMDNQVKANGIGVSLYGTKWEDMEADTMYSLGNINGGIKDVDGAMKRSGDNVDKTFSQKLQVAWRDAQADLVPLGEKLLEIGERYLPKITGAIGKMTDKFTDLSPQMQDLVLGVGGFAALIGPVVLGISTVAGAVATSSLAVGGFAGALGLLTNPVGLTIGALALLGLGYLAVDKAMDKPIIKSDLFKGKISKATEEAVGSYMKLNDDAKAELDSLNWSQQQITDKMAKHMISTYDNMYNTVLQTMQENHAKQLSELQKLFDDSEVLTEKEEAKRMAKAKATQLAEEKNLSDNQQKIRDIWQNAADEKRGITDAEAKQIALLQTNMKVTAVKEMSASQKEQVSILKNLKDQKGIIETETAGNTVKKSKDTRDKVVKEADKEFKEKVASAKNARDNLRTITKDEADKIIQEAERKKDKTVAKAEDMHYEVVKQAQQQSGEHVSEVNWETGSVLSKWDTMWNGIADVWNPIADLFGLDKMKKRGVYQVNGRQRQKDQGATIAAYADGTNGHQGGLALVGDGTGSNSGSEAIITPDGNLSFSPSTPTIMNLPVGANVLSATNTRKIFGSIPKYADGVGDFSLLTKGAKGIFDYFMNKTNFYGKYQMPSWFASIETIMDKIGGGMVKKIDKALDGMFSFGAGGSVPTAGSGVQRWAGIASQALRMTGQFSAANLQRLLYQMQTESGGNPRAINLWDINAKNGTPSKGLMQVIDPTFRAYAMSPFNKDVYDPLSNILASIRYAISRYGSLGNAYRGVGYATGGEINNPQVASLGENGYKEWVITSEPRYRQNNIELWKKAGQSLGVANNTIGNTIQVQQQQTSSPTVNVIQVVLNGRVIHEEIKKIDNEQTQMRNMFKGVR